MYATVFFILKIMNTICKKKYAFSVHSQRRKKIQGSKLACFKINKPYVPEREYGKTVPYCFHTQHHCVSSS